MNLLVLTRFVRGLERIYEAHAAAERAGGLSGDEAHVRAFEYVRKSAMAELESRQLIPRKTENEMSDAVRCPAGHAHG